MAAGDLTSLEDRTALGVHALRPGSTVLVTGTNGKTSTTMSIRDTLARLGRRSACYSSLGIAFPGRPPTAFTTEWMLSAATIGMRLKTWREAVGPGAALIAEVTSVWLGMGVTAALGPIDVGVLTSLGEDHLEQHGGRAAYHALKLGLLAAVRRGGAVVYPTALAPRIVSALKTRRPDLDHYPVGTNGIFVLQRSTACLWEGCSRGTVELADGSLVEHSHHSISLVLHENALLASAAASALGATPGAALAASDGLAPPAGRCQIVRTPQGQPVAIVDAAHNPEAFAACLRTARRVHAGRTVAVFGCGGQRDRWKRAAMGRIAGDLADAVVVTDDNPRGDSPAEIRAEVLVGYPNAVEIAGRREGLLTARSLAGPTGLVVALGMGATAWRDTDGVRRTDAAVLSDSHPAPPPQPARYGATSSYSGTDGEVSGQPGGPSACPAPPNKPQSRPPASWT